MPRHFALITLTSEPGPGDAALRPEHTVRMIYSKVPTNDPMGGWVESFPWLGAENWRPRQPEAGIRSPIDPWDTRRGATPSLIFESERGLT
jgi:hypothetical protein